ncbi:MAG: hypothetical protein ACI8UO_006098, partial [Verrucomicrobiales bacterium]
MFWPSSESRPAETSRAKTRFKSETRNSKLEIRIRFELGELFTHLLDEIQIDEAFVEGDGLEVWPLFLGQAVANDIKSPEKAIGREIVRIVVVPEFRDEIAEPGLNLLDERGGVGLVLQLGEHGANEDGVAAERVEEFADDFVVAIELDFEFVGDLGGVVPDFVRGEAAEAETMADGVGEPGGFVGAAGDEDLCPGAAEGGEEFAENVEVGATP